MPSDDELPIVELVDLCWWAETADGCRTDGSYLIRKGKKVYLKKGSKLDPTERANAIARICKVSEDYPNDTPPSPQTDIQPPPPTIKGRIRIGFYLEGGEYPEEWIKLDTMYDDEICDAYFVTTSALRKFVIPYYEAHRLLNSEDMGKLRATRIMERQVIGIAHYPPSHDEPVLYHPPTNSGATQGQSSGVGDRDVIGSPDRRYESAVVFKLTPAEGQDPPKITTLPLTTYLQSLL